jgi:hypothetical protein
MRVRIQYWARPRIWTLWCPACADTAYRLHQAPWATAYAAVGQVLEIGRTHVDDHAAGRLFP